MAIFRLRALALLTTLAAAGCRPRADSSRETPPTSTTLAPAMSASTAEASDSAAPPARPPEGAPAVERWQAREEDEVFEVIGRAFSLAQVELRVVDLEMGRTLRPAMSDPAVQLAINGGFFDRQGRPDGLVRAEGRELSALRRPLSGGVLSVSGGRGQLQASEAVPDGFAPPFAVQCLPRLVVDGQVHIKKSDGRRAERSALCLRQQGRELLALVAMGERGGPSLRALALFAARVGCHDALNLDGGPSTGMMWRERGDVRGYEPRGPLRHAIVVRSR